MRKIFSLISLAMLSGCFQGYNEDDDLRTVPITNNPTIIPNYGSSAIPGFSLQPPPL